MSGLFSTEGKFYGALSLAADLVIVNVMLLVTMLPVVTGGAAMRAATVVITQLLNNEAATPVRTFIRELTRKWTTATAWWCIATTMTLFAVYELYVISRAEVGSTTRLLLCASVLSGVYVITAVNVWFYPLAREGGLSSVLVRSVRLTFTQPLRTIVGVVLSVSPVLIFTVGIVQLGAVLAFYALIGVAFTQYLVLLTLGENAGVISR